jgi:KaiC/GvpD/RAD55 family RecA-like ATPase
VRQPDEFDLDPEAQVIDETIEASSDLFRPEENYHHMPWGALDQVMGGMPGGEVCTVCAFSSQGKTTYLTSLVDELFETTKKKIYFMGLESKPKTLRTHWAAKRCGIDAGDLLSGAFLKWMNFREVRDTVGKEIASQREGEKYARVRFCPTSAVNADNLFRAADQAAEFGADLFIIDHIDHIDGTLGKSEYSMSVEVTRAILKIAQEYGFLMMPSSQLNNEAVKHNRIALHLPPQPQHVKFGGHKREMSTWMIGLYRPLRVAGVDPKELAAVNLGLKKATDILEPNTMGISFMKHRFYGNREWSKVYLRVEKGKVMDADQQLYVHRTVDGDGMRMSP